MAINIPVPVKPYAVVGNTEGVPLSDLERIVGQRTNGFVHTFTLNESKASNTSFQLNLKPLATTPSIQVRIVSGGTELFIGDFDPISLLGVVAASEGDTLVQDGTNSQTAIRVLKTGGSINQVIVGRTDTNLLLVQATRILAANDVISLDRTEFSGGAINERLLRTTSQPPHELRLIQKSASKPNPPANAEYDGAIVTNIDDWVDHNTILTGNDPEWLATATTTFNQLAQRWVIGEWAVVSNSNGVHVQYSLDLNTWQDTRVDNHMYRRFRDSNGSWIIEELAGNYRGWELIVSRRWEGPYSIVDYLTQARAIIPTNLDMWNHILLEWVWGSGKKSCVVVPTKSITLATHFQDFGDPHTRVARFRRNNTGASFDDPQWENIAGSSNNQAIFQWQLEAHINVDTFPVEERNTAHQIRFDPAAGSLVGQLNIYRGL